MAAAAITPAAGPDNAVRAGRAFQLAEIVGDAGLQIGIQRGGGGALELTDLRQDLAAHADMRRRPDGAHRGRGGALVLRVGVAVDEDDGAGLRATSQQFARGRLHGGDVHLRADRAIGERAFRHLDPHVTLGDRRELTPEPPGLGPVAAAHLQHVAEAGRGDDAEPRALAFQQRVRADGRAVDDRLEPRGAAQRAQPVHEAHGLVAAVGRDLGGAEAVGARVEEEQVGEGAADIDTHDGLAGHSRYP
jgi:hypothetical protein